MSFSALICAAWAAAASPSPLANTSPVSLEFRELLEPAITPCLSARVRALDGQQIRLVGFMAQLEEPPNGAFYLVPHPLFCDEGGGGTADLPLEAIRVLVRSSPDVPIRFIPGLLEVTGVLRVGNRPDGGDGSRHWSWSSTPSRLHPRPSRIHGRWRTPQPANDGP